MRRILLAGTVALLSSTAMAQTVTFEVAPAERTRIKEYVVRQNVRPYATQERVQVGTTLPAEVELREAPADWGPAYSRYRYIYSNDRIYFVDPTNRRVIYDID